MNETETQRFLRHVRLTLKHRDINPTDRKVAKYTGDVWLRDTVARLRRGERETSLPALREAVRHWNENNPGDAVKVVIQ